MRDTPTPAAESLPALQAVLDRLGAGQDLRLTNADCDRLFGINDALVGRVANFARGHGCNVVWDEAGLTFRRPLPAVDPLPPPAGAAPAG